ncbi:coiled-coil domain-containing protein 124 isoform X2 [Pleurodeles waltl]|uniref:coiled-coil domain-containing protein 124 isoform X2 n=1 Tax=Pleurodeles waltl TaxID=8319 RepID=UPI0037094A5C
MPKKFQGENTKSAVARARKADAKAAADAKRQQEQDDALWKDEDKHVLRKEQRKEDKEKRRLEQLERKKEAQRLLDEEAASLKGKLQKNVATPPKITRAQIEETLRVEEKEASKSAEKPKSHVETPLEENINRRVLEEGTVEARTVEEAISVLSVGHLLHPSGTLVWLQGCSANLFITIDQLLQVQLVSQKSSTAIPSGA